MTKAVDYAESNMEMKGKQKASTSLDKLTVTGGSETILLYPRACHESSAHPVISLPNCSTTPSLEATPILSG